MPQTPPRYSGPSHDPAAAIVAVAVPGLESPSSSGAGGPGYGPISGGVGWGGRFYAPRDVVFVVTELGYVYRSVDGGTPALVFTPIAITEKGRTEP